MKGPCLKVPREHAEESRKLLMTEGSLDIGYLIQREEEHVIIPVVNMEAISTIDIERWSGEMVERFLVSRKNKPRSYKELLELPDEIADLMPNSFDIIGDIAIIKLDSYLRDHAQVVGSALLKFNKNIGSVMMDKGVKGEFRVRDLEFITGDEDLDTIHIENNLRFKLDPSKVFFSPRLATERMRIASLTRKEKVLDMFAGIGPFSLNIARHGKAVEIIGIDLNPDCIYYFKKNISLNSMEDRIEAFLGDAGEISSSFAPFDRVIMNLPHSSIDFFQTAMNVIDRGSIHFYRIIDDDKIMDSISEILNISRSIGKRAEISGTRVVHHYSPSRSLMVFDILVT